MECLTAERTHRAQLTDLCLRLFSLSLALPLSISFRIFWSVFYAIIHFENGLSQFISSQPCCSKSNTAQAIFLHFQYKEHSKKNHINYIRFRIGYGYTFIIVSVSHWRMCVRV